MTQPIPHTTSAPAEMPDMLSEAALAHLLATRDAMRETIDLPLQHISALYDYFLSLTETGRAARAGECLFEPGQIIMHEDTVGDYAFLIWSGEIAVIMGDLHLPTILAYRGPGALVGEMSLIDDQPRSATVVALDRIEALCIAREDFEDLLRDVPSLALDTMRMLSSRLRQVQQLQQAQIALAEALTQQLEQAGQEQLSLLPHDPPRVPGWDFAMHLTPVWQTSGDFYDFVELDGGKLGILVADVADKGTRAAMYMALSCTLLRTYAKQYPNDPARVLAAANARLLADTDSDQFVTVFYGVLDPASGTFTYANAGHNPAIVVPEPPNSPALELPKTGAPLGVLDSMTWTQHHVDIGSGGRLLIYTDGISEAANLVREQFGLDRICALARLFPGSRADELRVALMAAVRTFVGAADQGDDMTLLVAMRK